MSNNATTNNAWKSKETTMLKGNLGPSNMASWGTQSQPNLGKEDKHRKLHGKNSIPKRDEEACWKHESKA